jgi:hypothetical protein
MTLKSLRTLEDELQEEVAGCLLLVTSYLLLVADCWLLVTGTVGQLNGTHTYSELVPLWPVPSKLCSVAIPKGAGGLKQQISWEWVLVSLGTCCLLLVLPVRADRHGHRGHTNNIRTFKLLNPSNLQTILFVLRPLYDHSRLICNGSERDWHKFIRFTELAVPHMISDP